MPKKLLDCVKKVIASGKDRSSAIAICVASTGLKMEKDEIVKLLDKNNITENNKEVDTRMKIKLVTKQDIVEAHDNPFSEITEAGIDSDNFTLSNVCLFGRKESINLRTYSDKAIDSLTVLAEGCKCFADHPTKTSLKDSDGVRSIRDLIGVFEGAHRSGDKVLANLRVREAYWDLMHDIATMQPKGTGMSINAQVKVYQDDKGMESVQDVALLRSTDCVSSAATTSSLWESLGTEMAKNLTKDEEEDFEVDVEERVKAKFDEVIAAEGVIQDKLDNDKLKYEVSDITYTASDMISTVMRGDDPVGDKKSKVMKIFDDLSSEIKKRLTKIKKESIEEMDITLAMVKENKSIMESLLSEFKEKEDTVKMKADITSATEANTALKTDSDKKDEKIKELTDKVTALESEKKDLALKLDEIEVSEKIAEKRAQVQGWVSEAKLPEECVTKLWVESLLSLNDKKGEDDKVITFETQVKEYIEDRRLAGDKKKPVVKGAGDEFVNKTATESNKDKKKDTLDRKEVEESVDNFVFSAKK